MAEKKIIKGSGKKGGTIFPRIALNDAIPLMQKLVSKTHIAPQPAAIVLPGVFGTSGPHGQIKASALKQYGLLEGKSDAYTASALARKIGAAPVDERPALYGEACLTPKVFRLLFHTFHGDTVSIAKLKQQAAQAGVHPDFLDVCAGLFVKSAAFASLGKIEGDNLQLVALDSLKKNDVQERESGVVENGDSQSEASADDDSAEPGKLAEEQGLGSANEERDSPPAKGEQSHNGAPMRAVINVNVTLDSSLDTEKLERQLALLRKYGAL